MSKGKRALLLINLGTPAEPTRKGVARFLKKFLSDPRVVEAPRAIWWLLLRLLVIPLRAKRVARAYREIWWEEGSPISVICERQANKLQRLLEEKFESDAPAVVAAATYGEISLAEQIDSLKNRGVESFIVLPMYPQYSGSTTGAVYDQIAKLTLRSRDVPDIRIIKSYYREPAYIAALAESVLEHWQKVGRGNKLLMSFHGVPVDYIEKGDPYFLHCEASATLLATALGLEDGDWAFSFQSRFGPKEWLQPYTDKLLEQWAVEGIGSVDVISPAFTADCLETLEELNMAGRRLFLDAGGQKFSYISCLNDNDAFIKFLSELAFSR